MNGRTAVRTALVGMLVAMTIGGDVRVRAQERFLGKADIVLLGLGLRVEPDHQVVPKDVATIVSTFLQAPTDPQNPVPPFAPDAVLKGTLRGPGAGNGIPLTARPNTPFAIPPISVAGLHTLEDIRLESGGQVLLRAVPESVSIEVIDKLLVTQVTARPLTAQEIREKGIVFDKSNFQAYNFTAAFAAQDTPITISFPVVLPSLQGAQDATLSGATLSGIAAPALPELKTIIPDTLRLQTQLPNLKVVGFTLSVPTLTGQSLVVPPIPAAVVFPGDIGFLNQYFSALLMVGNVAPAGSSLVVQGLRGELFLPAGIDTVAGSADDPLRMALTARGEAPRVQSISQPGPDGKLGTADDVNSVGPGETGSAEYLVEGRREGTHVIEFAIAGTLHGLPGGDVPITGRAAGAVLVRNPAFTLTFTHPETVAAGEPYSLDVTVTNTSAAPANFVSVNLLARNIAGASLVGDSSRQIESIAPGDAATISFDLIARVTGRVTAATLDGDENVQGRFSLKAAVGELGVPVSPDSLVLPKEADGLPAGLRTAALGLLGKAWAVATAPAAALPKDVTRFSRQIVLDRTVQVAEAGMRAQLHEPVAVTTAQLAMDFIGSDFTRLGARYPDPGDLALRQADFAALDALRRRSIRGDVFAAAVGRILAPEVAGRGAAAFHQAFAEAMSYRPGHLSVLVTSAGGPLAVVPRLVDPAGRQTGGVDAAGKIVKSIPFSDVIPLMDAQGVQTGALIVLAAPAAGEHRLQFDRARGVSAAPFDVSIITPDAGSTLRQVVYAGLSTGSVPGDAFTPADPHRVVIDLPLPGEPPAGASAPISNTAVVAPPPHVISVVQQADKDVTSCTAVPLARIVAVLFSEEVTAASIQDRLAASAITNYAIEQNRVVGVALQPGGRVAFLALRDPIGPFVPRQITIAGATDGRGRTMAPETVQIETTVDFPQAALISGQVLGADGRPVPFANVRLLVADGTCGLVGVSSKSADAQGRFGWDWVPGSGGNVGFDELVGGVSRANRVTAVDLDSNDSRSVDFTVQRNGQPLNVNIVFLGRGTLRGRTLDENGAPLANTDVKVSSLTDQSSYGARTDASGRFTIARLPVGNLFIEAVNVAAGARGAISELMPLSGATVTRDMTLFSLTAPKVVVAYGALSGHVLRGDGATAVADVPVIAYYKHESQPGVRCPNQSAECAVGVVRTDAAGAFLLDHLPAGQVRLVAFDAASFQQGDVRLTTAANTTTAATILLGQGLATVQGVVLDGDGRPVPNAQVGGGLSLTTTDGSGRFTLTDVPVGHREIAAVSEALGTRGSSVVDILQAGQTVNVTVVLERTASVAGTVVAADGVTPVANTKVYLFYVGTGPDGPIINIVATAQTDAAGRYTMVKVPLREYVLSAFRPDFSDGNVRTAVLKFNNQVFRGDITFRGGGGRITGAVFNADGTTPVRAALGLSGDQVVVAGGLVGTGFQHVTNYQVTNNNFTTGAFAFDNVFVGPFTLSAVGQFSPDPVSFAGTIPSPGASVHLDLRLQATSRIQGTVLQPDGVTPVGANVLVHYKSAAFKHVCAYAGNVTIGNQTIAMGECDDVPQGIQDETVITDAAGHYVLPLVNAGPFTLTAEDPATGRSAQADGAIKPGQVGDFNVRLLGLGTLTINVRGNNTITPIPGARVEVTQLTFPKKAIIAAADGQGSLILSGGDAFAEGEVVVKATDLATGFAGRATGRVTREGDNVTINVYLYNASGSVFGRVFKADGQTPVPNAEVVISNTNGPLAFAVTNAAGQYRQDLIPLGAFRIDVFEAATARHGFAAGRVDFDTQQVPVDITEAGRGIVTGTALAAGSLAPLKNWEVFLTQWTPDRRTLSLLQTTTDVDGTFSFPGVSVGPFSVTVTKRTPLPGEGYGNAMLDGALSTDGQRVDVPVVVQVVERHFGRVEGTVVNPDGTPAPNVPVEVCPSDCGPGSTQGRVGAVTAGDGSFAVDHVLIGRLTVSARSQTSFNATADAGVLLFEGDVARFTLTLVGLSQVTGSVVFSDGRPAPNVQVLLSGRPGSGCSDDPRIPCAAFADAAGRFSFINVSARTFDVRAVDLVNGLTGAVSGALNPGDRLDLRIVLQPTARVTGRALSAAGVPIAGISARLTDTAFGHQLELFQASRPDGTFQFDAVPIGQYLLTLQDPIGPGFAQRALQVTGQVSVGDVRLDEAPPVVVGLSPAASAQRVPRESVIRITFSEPVSAGSVNQTNITVVGPSGPVVGTLQLIDGDTTALFTPLGVLGEKTRYAIAIANVTDLFGKVIVPVATNFTTVDLTPPAILDVSPAQAGNGVAIASVVRVHYNEPIDPARFRGPPIVVTRGAAPVSGRIEYILGNTVVVFTPAVPLDENAEYRVTLATATDLSGNEQAQGQSYAFFTSDRTAPEIVALTAAGDGTVIENSVTRVVADVGTAHDVSVVDFFINDQPAAAARTAPFTLTLQAVPAWGHPGDRIKVSALATDTSGNRGTTPAVTFVTVVADAPPAVTILSPAAGTSFRNGALVTVVVRATDDLGTSRIAYRAQTGHPQDAATRAVTPASVERTETFSFTVAADAVPGAPIVISATATDSKEQTVAATPVSITVLDATPPAVSITGTTTGTRVAAGQQTSAVVSAQDLGGIASLTFTTGGALVSSITRPVAPAQGSVVSSFPFTVPATAHPGDVITLDAIATDTAGNATSAARILLPVADINAPTVELSTVSGSLEIAPGTTATVRARVEDESGVASVTLNGQGAFTVTTARQVSPPSNSTDQLFQIAVPANAPPGATLDLSASAVDVFGNAGTSARLSLVVAAASVQVTLPPSLLIAAGESATIAVQLAEPAPAGGVRVDLASAETRVAVVNGFVQFAPGQTQQMATVTAFSGGSTAVTASIGGIARTSMTVTVRGGIVTGLVFDEQFHPVAGAQVSVASGNTFRSAITDAEGRYLVEGVGASQFVGGAFTVKVIDPATQRIGYRTGTLADPNGFAHVDVVLLVAGRIHGTVRRADGVTPAAAGAQVDLFASTDTLLQDRVGRVFTGPDGSYEFPIVTLGSYVAVASDTTGNRGRSSAALIAASGQDLTLSVAYLGRSALAVTVLDGANRPVGNIPVTLLASSIFGQEPPISTNTQADGTVSFPGVFVGSATVRAIDTSANLAGTAVAAVAADGQIVPVVVRLAPWGGLQGTAFRADGATPLPNAAITLSVGGATFRSTTDVQGGYAFTFVPLGSFRLEVREPGTRGIGMAQGSLTTQGVTITRNVTLFGQGSLLVTVLDAGGAPVPGAILRVSSNNGVVGDGFDTTGGSDGVQLVEHVLASNDVSVAAFGNGLSGAVLTTLAAGEVKPITVRLEPTGTIAGTVFQPDGQTPASGGNVDGAPIGPDGTFRIEGRRLGLYSLTASDAQGRKRAILNNVAITANGQVTTANLTFVGLASVTGRVLNPDGSSAPGLFVTVRSLDPVFGGFASAQTDAGGFYRADDLIVGQVAVSTGDVSRGLLGEAFGALAGHGITLNLDILLKNNAVPLPVTRSDANQYPFDIQKDGSIARGQGFVFVATSNAFGASHLNVVQGGTAIPFTGANIGTTEANGREVAVTQSLAGLNITRKVLVSQTYFARYLEILTNPTAAPVTVDVQIQHWIRQNSPLSVLGTSSGDAVLDLSDPASADRWIAIATSPDAEAFNATPQLAVVFDGPGAGRRASTANVATSFSGAAGLNFGWSNVTVQPGQTVILMHFLAQQYSGDAALASAQRLVQLPPEALESLTPTELAQISNFAVPADGTSPIAPLPALGGTVSGRVLEADAVTPVIASLDRVRFKSNNIFFGRTFATGTDASGSFSLGPLGDLIHRLGPLTIPLDGFTLTAIHPVTSVASPPVIGSFAPGATTATADVLFSNTGIVRGLVRRHTGVVVPGASIVAAIGTETVAFANSASDGAYAATGLRPGPVTLTAALSHPQSTFGFQGGGLFKLKTSVAVSVTAGGVQTLNVALPPTGTLTGTVRTAVGNPAVNALVNLLGVDPSDASTMLQTRTDSAGGFRINDAPLGTYNVQAVDPATGLGSVPGVATIRQDETSAVALALRGAGSLQVSVVYTTGAPGAFSLIELQKTPLGPQFVPVGYSDAAGQFTIANVPTGGFIVRVHRSSPSGDLVTDVSGTLSTDGQVLAVRAVLVPVGSALVQVNSVSGAPVANSQVQILKGSSRFYSLAGTTDAAGQLLIPNIEGGQSFSIRAFDTAGFGYRLGGGTITAEGQTVPVTIVLGTVGTLRGRITYADGTPAVDVLVIAGSDDPRGFFNVSTDSAGRYTIGGVAIGTFRVWAQDSTRRLGGSANGQIVAHGDIITTDLVLNDVLMPATLTDANGTSFYLAAHGAAGLNSFAATEGLISAFELRTEKNGNVDYFFGGDFAAAPSQNRRQLSMRDYGGGTELLPRTTSGLLVTRKIFVPESGYFVRYLEVFDNPTGAPVSTTVQMQSSLNTTRIATTSSGDTTYNPGDLWYVSDNPATPATPAVGHVIGGPGAARGVTAAQPTVGFRVSATEKWDIVVPAGGRVILMHFAVLEPSATAAQTAVERLVQLPSEAIEGLLGDERRDIVNFSVPQDGVSTVPPFSTVTGRALAGDGVTPVPGARISVTGNAALYRGTVTVTADGAGAYRASSLATGPFTVRGIDPATGAQTAVASGTIPNQGDTVPRDVSFAGTGIVVGSIRYPNGSFPTSGTVFVTGTGPGVTGQIAAPISQTGTYAVWTMPPGPFTAEWTAPQGGIGQPLRIATTTGFASAGQRTTADLTIPATATVRVTVRQTSGELVTSAYLYITDGYGGPRYVGTPDQSGILLIRNVPQGPFQVVAYQTDNVTLIGSVSGAVTGTDDLQTIDVAIQSRELTVSGTVRAGDGTTPVPDAYVQLFDEGALSATAAVSADAAGHFEFTHVLLSGPSVRVVAHSPSDFALVGEQSAVIGSGPVVIDVTLPAIVVSGRVFLADGVTAIAGGRVVASQEDAAGNLRRLFAETDADGHYVIFGGAPGTVAMRATDSPRGLIGEVNATIAEGATAVTVNVQLGPAGRVTGVVRDSDGTPLPFAWVSLASGRFDLYNALGATTDADGRYTIERVPVGPFVVQSCATGNVSAGTYLCGTARGALANDGDETVVDVQLPGVGSLSGGVFAADGVTPAADSYVYVVGGDAGPAGQFSVSAQLDASGHFTIPAVPEGLVSVYVYGPPTYQFSGVAFATIVPGADTAVAVSATGAQRCFTQFTTSSGFLFDLQCGGEIGSGGTTDGRLSDAYAPGYVVRVNGVQPGTNVSTQAMGGRQAVYDGMRVAGLVATRKVYVPETASFARYVDSFKNATSGAISVEIQLESVLGGSVHEVVSPAATGNTYAVTLGRPSVDAATGTTTVTRPLLGHVFAGSEAGQTVTAVRFQRLDGTSYSRWFLTIAPGETASLLHFALQGEPGDAAGMISTIGGLLALTDPGALAGLTPAERASIVNFKLR